VSNSATTNSSSGVGLGGLLFVAFLCLKLTGVIAWSWWWVTAPLWGPLVVVVAIIAAMCLPWIFGDRR
jgi:hypothetical protein